MSLRNPFGRTHSKLFLAITIIQNVIASPFGRAQDRLFPAMTGILHMSLRAKRSNLLTIIVSSSSFVLFSIPLGTPYGGANIPLGTGCPSYVLISFITSSNSFKTLSSFWPTMRLISRIVKQLAAYPGTTSYILQ